MSYGLKVWDNKGQSRITIGDRLSRLFYSKIVAADTSGNVTLAGLAGKKSVQFGISTVSSAGTHMVTRVGNTIYWVADDGSFTSGESLVVVFIYT